MAGRKDSGVRSDTAGGILGKLAGRLARAELPREALRLPGGPPVSRAVPHPWRAARILGSDLTPLEEFWVNSPDGSRVQSFLVKPYGFQEGHRYPVLFLIHGGPQGFWGPI